MWTLDRKDLGQIVRAAALGGAIYDVGIVDAGIATGPTRPGRRWSSRPRRSPGCFFGPTVGSRPGRRKSASGRSHRRSPFLRPSAPHQRSRRRLGHRQGIRSQPQTPGSGYLGPGWSKNVMGRVINAGIWGGAAVAAYNAGVGKLTKTNDKVEPGYATPPTAPEVSGSPESVSTFEELGLQGRRYVIDVTTPELIEEVMGETGQGPADSGVRRFQHRAALLHGSSRAGAHRARPHGGLRPVLFAPGVSDRHRLGGPDHDRGRRAAHQGRHRHLLHPVRPLAVVPRRATSGPGAGPVPAPALGDQGEAPRAPTREAAQGPRCSARAWAPGHPPTSSCTRGFPVSTITGSTAPFGSAFPGWPSGRGRG